MAGTRGSKQRPFGEGLGQAIREVHWNSQHLMVLNVGGTVKGSAFAAWIAGCRLICPPEKGATDSESYPIFDNINSIGEGNSALLNTLPAAAVFTADAPRSVTRPVTTGTFGALTYDETWYYQTIFVNLNKFAADANGEKEFALSVPAITASVQTVTAYVAWKIVQASGGPPSPLPFVFPPYLGETLYDQQGVFHNTINGAPSGYADAPIGQYTGQIFESDAEGFAYIASPPPGSGHTAEPPGNYTFYPMLVDAEVFGAGVGFDINTYSRSSIGGPSDLENFPTPAGTPLIRGDFAFPLFTVVLATNPDTGLLIPPRKFEDWLYSYNAAGADYSTIPPDAPPGVNWPIGAIDSMYPWPGLQWNTARVSLGSNDSGVGGAAPTLTPAAERVFQILPAKKADSRPAAVVNIPPS